MYTRMVTVSTVTATKHIHDNLAGGGESITRPITMSSSTVYLEVWYGSSSLERTARRMAGHCWALDLRSTLSVSL